MRRVLFTLALLASPTAFAGDADQDLTLKIKTAIAAEPALKNLSVMVSVVDGVAVIGGAVPSAATNDSLSKLIRTVPGLSDVRINCWVAAGEDPLGSAVQAKLKPQPELKAKTVALPLALPATFDLSSAYSPVPPPAPPAPPGPSEHATIPSPRLPTTPGQDVATAVEAVRRSDAKFAGLVLSVQAGAVTIAGEVSDAGEPWLFAAAVRRVPGVDKVIVGRTTVR